MTANTMRVGFLGCGKIGQAMLEHILRQKSGSVAFVQDIVYNDAANRFPVLRGQDASLLAQADLVVESATADALKADFDGILAHCDLMPFSVTAFSDARFEAHAREMAERHNRRIYLPHGAILGLEGIADGRSLLTDVSIVTTKSPASLGRADTARTVVYEGPTREACALYPRNVNVHAAVALAGLGFDKTRSSIISDPAVTTNAHEITVAGEGILFTITVSSAATGGVTGKYTPYSACASLTRVLQKDGAFRFV